MNRHHFPATFAEYSRTLDNLIDTYLALLALNLAGRSPINLCLSRRLARSETALIYNDKAVLENFHISQAFSLLRNEDCNILAGLTKDEYR